MIRIITYFFWLLVIVSNSLCADVVKLSGVNHSTVNQIQFFSDSHGIVATNKGLYKTQNGGKTWVDISSNLPYQHIDSLDISSYTKPIKGFTSNDGKVIYAYYTYIPWTNNSKDWEQKIYVTKDSGATWHYVPQPKNLGQIRSFQLTSDNDLIIYNGSCLYKKFESESNFNKISCPHSKYFKYVNEHLIYSGFSNQTSGYNNFRKSIDGGRTWIDLASFDIYIPNDANTNINFDADDRAIVINVDITEQNNLQSHYLIRSFDEGESWETIYMGESNSKSVTITRSKEGTTYFSYSDYQIYKIPDHNLNLELLNNSTRTDDRICKGCALSTIAIINDKLWIGSIYGLFIAIPDYLGQYSVELVSNFDVINDKYAHVYISNDNKIMFMTSIMDSASANIYFLNVNINTRLQKSDDGINWSYVKLDDDIIDVKKIYINDNNEFYMLADAKQTNGNIQERIYLSLDYGNNWSVIYKSMSSQTKLCNLPDKNFIVGNDKAFCGNKIAVLYDENYSAPNLFAPSASSSFIDYYKDNIAVLIDNYNLLVSYDKGVRWDDKINLKDLFQNNSIEISDFQYVGLNEFLLVYKDKKHSNHELISKITIVNNKIQKSDFYINKESFATAIGFNVSDVKIYKEGYIFRNSSDNQYFITDGFSGSKFKRLDLLSSIFYPGPLTIRELNILNSGDILFNLYLHDKPKISGIYKASIEY